MSLDLGSPVIEVAIGLSFVFFLLSLIVSALTEAFAWAFKQRAKTLEAGVKGMLGDGCLAAGVLRHPLVQSDVTTSPVKKKPSYLSARNFSLALVDVLAKQGEPNTEANDTLAKVAAGVDRIAPQAPEAATQLQVLLGESDASSLGRFRKSAEDWFDDAMDRVSGWYKRRAQIVAIVAALIVAVGLKADAVSIGEQLANEPTVRAAVVAKAEEAAGSEEDPRSAGESVDDAITELDALKLPLLWGADNDDIDLTVIVGLLITTIALSLGAPFWFDTLGKLAHLRTAGKKPEKEK